MSVGYVESSGLQAVIEQVSLRINPEVHSRRVRGPQGPDPPASPYFAETLSQLYMYLVYRHGNHVRLSVFIAIEAGPVSIELSINFLRRRLIIGA